MSIPYEIFIMVVPNWLIPPKITCFISALENLTDKARYPLVNVVEEVIRCDKELTQKNTDLLPLNRYVFVQLISMEILLKCPSASFPSYTVWHEGKKEIGSHSAMDKNFNV